MASVLSVYNDALQLLGERKLASATEDRPVRHKLDTLWSGELLNWIAEDADWNCFMVSAKIEADDALTPSWGHRNVFTLPDALLKISGVWSDERLKTPLTDHIVEGSNIYASVDPIYIRYVPDNVVDSIGTWPPYFSRYVSSELALQLAPDLRHEDQRVGLLVEHSKRKSNALSRDAMMAPTKKLPTGSWVRSRSTGRHSR